MKETTLQPFGIVVAADPFGQSLHEMATAMLKGLVAQHRVLTLRGFAPLTETTMLNFCKTLGAIMEWEFGSVNDLKVKENASNYLYTNREVPFHWDGAFAGKVPHYIFFFCEAAPESNSGGETTFCDTIKLLRGLPADKFYHWQNVSVTYKTQKIVHYGGEFSSPLIATHPVSGEKVLRFAEPVKDLNPVTVEVQGLGPEAQVQFLKEMNQLLNSPLYCYAHTWQQGDIVIADNHALLHGRRAFVNASKRHLRRVNIL